MKKIISYIQLIVSVVYLSCFVSCQDNSSEDAITKLTIKAFSPTVVMEGGEMVIVGNRLEQVNSIVFPGNIEVANFELVTSNQIKLSIPAGISAEGGFLKLVSNEGSVESIVAMRVARPEIKSLLPGDEIGVGQELNIKGVDLEYTKQVVFKAETDDAAVTIEVMDFLRKASESIRVMVPDDVKRGENTISLIAINGETTVSNPIKISNNAVGGKLETDVFYTIWEDPEGLQFNGWMDDTEGKFQSDYFKYIAKEGYEYTVYYTYISDGQAGGVGLKKIGGTNGVIYIEANTSDTEEPVKKAATQYKNEQSQLNSCVPGGSDFACLRGAHLTLYKVEIVFTKIP